MIYILITHSARLLVLSVLFIAACGGVEKPSAGANSPLPSKTVESEDILSLCIQHKNIAFHIHMTLEIYILGKKQVIPANAGIPKGCMHIIHTHDKTGELHIESPYYHQFHLKDFFTIW